MDRKRGEKPWREILSQIREITREGRIIYISASPREGNQWKEKETVKRLIRDHTSGGDSALRSLAIRSIEGGAG